jgi:hypothetical protein
MGHRKIRGIALISTFMFVGLLFMMAAAMVVTSRNRVFTGVSQHHQAQAFYLAESGLVRAMVALENNLDWPGVTNATIDGMPGTYTVEFGTDKFGSVKNIGGLGAAGSYRGSESVPINSALLIVQANVSGQRYVLEAIVDGQGSIGYMSDAILTSGKIRAEGDLYVDGISSLDDSDTVDGSIQSNMPGSTDLVVWNADPGDKATITGNVGTQGSSDAAINMPGADIQGAPELNSLHSIPNHDITNEIDSNSGPAPTFVDGGTTTLGSGKHKISGNQTVNGDLILEDGAELYIDGDFEVLGSIKGNGNVWVSGETSFKGDASVTTGNNDQNISLFSKGSVKLTGFDGTEFMQSLNDPEVDHLLAVTEEAVVAFQTGAAQDDSVGNMEFLRNSAGTVLGLHLDGNMPGQGNQITFDYYNGLGDNGNVLGQLRNKIDALPPGDTQEFVSERLREVHYLFSSADDIEDDDPNVDYSEDGPIDQFLSGEATHASIDSVIGIAMTNGHPDQAQALDMFGQVINLLKTVNYDKPGAAYFQGAIYTQGYFYADNEVNVLGAIIVDGTPGTGEVTFNRKVFDPDTMGLEPGPEITLSSGDVYLGNRTRVTYVEEFFTDDPSDSSGPQNLVTMQWMGR